MQYSINYKTESPIILTAIHNGHNVRKEVLDRFVISESDRLREEDPYTNLFTDYSSANSLIVNTSRFELDLNRPRQTCVYQKPEDAWGLEIYKDMPSDDIISKSFDFYDNFYQCMDYFFSNLLSYHQHIFVLDIHSYNHHRLGPDKEFDAPEKNPDIILGTNILTSNQLFLVNEFQNHLKSCNSLSAKLDIRQNVKFTGGYFTRWINKRFHGRIIALAMEFKKTFMDEWTGDLYTAKLDELQKILFRAIRKLESHEWFKRVISTFEL